MANKFTVDVIEELCIARRLNRPMASAHEGYAVLLEEVDELWDEVKRTPAPRDYLGMYKELVQIAAMAQRMAEDIVLPALSEEMGNASENMA
jgi:hypothetical protein